MWSMTLATFAMGVWGATVVMMRIAPERTPSFAVVFVLAGLFAVPGFLLGVLTLRAKRSWLMVALVPLFANGSLFLMPWLASGLLER